MTVSAATRAPRRNPRRTTPPDFDVVFAAGRLVKREEVNRVATRQAWPTAWEQVQHRAQSLDPQP
jgi:hypothetical protein